MNKQAMLKGGAVLFALMMFTKVNGAASNSADALAETKKLREQLTAVSGASGEVDAAKKSDAAAADATDEEATADDAAAPADEGSDAAAKPSAKKTTTTLKKAATTTVVKKATTTTKALPTHWSYEGDGGPEHWAELDKANTACADGTAQSPIDIVDAKIADLPDLGIAWTPSAATVVNNGHTIQVDLKAGGTLTIEGTSYTLAQFHFHGPSEHTIGGRSYPLEVHFVHKDPSGKLAVIGVLVGEGAENAAFAPVIAKLPSKEGTPVALDGDLDARAMLPSIAASYRYEGSLTTPPCSEGVAWNVMAQPITMSKAQIAAITAKFAEPNNRPTQKLNGRALQLDISVSAN